MVVDQLTPGEVPWKHLAATPEVPALMRSYNQVLEYDFVYVPGHGNTGTKKDVNIQKEYVSDLKNNAQLAINNVNFTEVTKNVDRQNNAAITEAYFDALTNACVEKTEEKWKGKLHGVRVWTDEHFDKIINEMEPLYLEMKDSIMQWYGENPSLEYIALNFHDKFTPDSTIHTKENIKGFELIFEWVIDGLKMAGMI